MRNRVLVAIAAPVTVAAFVLSGCSSDGKSPAKDDHSGHAGTTTTLDSEAPPSTPVTDHNDADVTFAQQMIMHHQQAVDMSKLVDGHTSNPDIIALAAGIEGAQQPEIDKFTGWLTQWNQPTMPAGHDMGKMPGMVPDAVLDRMKVLNDKDFDTLWLQSMIAHHKGAIQMSMAEIANGKFAPAKQTAREIIANQQPEIDKMNALLTQE